MSKKKQKYNFIPVLVIGSTVVIVAIIAAIIVVSGLIPTREEFYT